MRNADHNKWGMMFSVFQTLYRYVLDDVYEYPILEKELKEFQKVLRIHRRQ